MTDQKTTNENRPEDALEAMIDKYSLSEVIDFAVCICAKKASHLRENRGDEIQAGDWSRAAHALLQAENRIQV